MFARNIMPTNIPITACIDIVIPQQADIRQAQLTGYSLFRSDMQ